MIGWRKKQNMQVKCQMYDDVGDEAKITKMSRRGYL